LRLRYLETIDIEDIVRCQRSFLDRARPCPGARVPAGSFALAGPFRFCLSTLVLGDSEETRPISSARPAPVAGVPACYRGWGEGGRDQGQGQTLPAVSQLDPGIPAIWGNRLYRRLRARRTERR
jgi:hypothetical protein